VADNSAPSVAPSQGDLALWVRTVLPQLNADALRGARSLASLIEDFNGVLETLDSPARCAIDECRRRLIILGMIGSSAERHSQETGNPPGQALSLLHVGDWPFRKYVATLASRAGGPPRDSLLSYVVWNAPAVHVYLPDAHTPFLTLPSAFPDDGPAGPLTFSDDPGERAAILLLKRCFALEAAANDHLWPLCEGSVTVTGHQALRHVEAATLFLKGVKAEIRLFLQRPEFTAPFFLDVMRQYACRWDPDDSYAAPSGAHDTAYIVRDKLLGTEVANYDTHIDLLFNVLDTQGQSEVSKAWASTAVVELVARELKVSPSELSELGEPVVSDMAFAHPWLANYFRLYQASADVSAAHWALIYKYMVGPMKERDYDAVVVSNYAGTTHMMMDTLRDYLSSRTEHPLSPFKDVFKPPGRRDDGLRIDVAGDLNG
jgi:hypothetical protein